MSLQATIPPSGPFTGNTLWVDIVNGVIGEGVKGDLKRPYKNPNEAILDAVAGDVVKVRPGSYTITANLAKDGVDWEIDEGVTFTGDAGVILFDSDDTPAKNYNVRGHGDYFGVGGQVIKHGDTSDVNFEANSIQSDAKTAIRAAGLQLTVKAKTIKMTGAGAGSVIVSAFAINCTIIADEIRQEGTSSTHTLQCIGSYSGETLVICPKIYAPVVIGDRAAVNNHSSSTAGSKITIIGNVIDERATNNGTNANGNAAIDILAGILEMEGDITADAYRCMVLRGATAGSVRYTGHMESTTDLDAVLIQDSEDINVFIKPGSEIKGKGTAPATISMGEGITSTSSIVGNYLELDGVVKNEHAGGGAHAIVKDGALPGDTELVLNTVKILCGAGFNSIFGVGAQDVVVNHKVTANRDVNANITNLVAPNQFSFDPAVI